MQKKDNSNFDYASEIESNVEVNYE